MENSEEAQAAIDMAVDSGLQDAIVVGRDSGDKVVFYTADASRERMIVLLERAKAKLVRTLDE